MLSEWDNDVLVRGPVAQLCIFIHPLHLQPHSASTQRSHVGSKSLLPLFANQYQWPKPKQRFSEASRDPTHIHFLRVPGYLKR